MNIRFVLCRADCADAGKCLGLRRSLGCTEESYFVLKYEMTGWLDSWYGWSCRAVHCY